MATSSPEDLDAATAELLLDNPAEVAKLQMQGLKQAFTVTSRLSMPGRFCLLVKNSHAPH